MPEEMLSPAEYLERYPRPPRPERFIFICCATLLLAAIITSLALWVTRGAAPTEVVSLHVGIVDPRPGRGDFTTVSEALAAVGERQPSRGERWLILVRPGTYQEPGRLRIPRWTTVQGDAGFGRGVTIELPKVKGQLNMPPTTPMERPQRCRLLVPAATLKLWREAAKQHYEGNLARLVREAVGEKLARLKGVT